MIVMNVLDAPRAWWDETRRRQVFQTPRLEDTMRGFHTSHPLHFQHVSAHSALASAREKWNDHIIEITMTIAILFGVLIVLTFWAVGAR
jgi:hypothetical protein